VTVSAVKFVCVNTNLLTYLITYIIIRFDADVTHLANSDAVDIALEERHHAGRCINIGNSWLRCFAVL